MTVLVTIQPGSRTREASLIRLLEEMDSEFNPPLSSRTSLADYIAKLLKFGRVVAVCENEDIVGMAGFYCNDLESRTGFFSILAVKASFRKLGLGKTLVEAVLRTAYEAGMKRVRLETSAHAVAFAFHERMGFHRVGVARSRPGGSGVIMEYAFAGNPFAPKESDE